MTDIISNIKIQKPVPIHTRRVSLQQNPNHGHLHQIKTSPLSNNNILPADSYVLAQPTNHLLLKSSLKLHGNIPTTTKSVRFNMPLVEVLHFHVPSAEEFYEQDMYDDDDEDDNDGDYFGDDQDDQDEEEENELEDAFLELFSKRLSPCSDYDPSLYLQQTILDSSLNLALQLPNWPIKHSAVVQQVVTLESLAWENARSIIKGRVLVRNLAFEKLVTVRMSFNHWQTWIDVDARFKESSEDAAFDRFVFELVTPNHLSYMNLINSDSHCSLAVKYQVNGAEYWDNNSGHNFIMQWSSCGYSDMIGAKKQEVAPSMVVRGSHHDVVSLLLEQQGKCPTTPVMTFYQEDTMQFQKEEYYATIISDGYPARNNMYIEPPAVDRYEKQDFFDGAFGVSSAQHQISGHLGFYLDRKKQDNEGTVFHYPRRRPVTDHGVNLMPVSLTPSSPLLIPPSRTELVIT